MTAQGLQARARAAARRTCMLIHGSGNHEAAPDAACSSCDRIAQVLVALAEGERKMEREECAKLMDSQNAENIRDSDRAAKLGRPRESQVLFERAVANHLAAQAIRARSTSAPAAPPEPQQECAAERRAVGTRCYFGDGEPFSPDYCLTHGAARKPAAPVPSSPEPEMCRCGLTMNYEPHARTAECVKFLAGYGPPQQETTPRVMDFRHKYEGLGPPGGGCQYGASGDGGCELPESDPIHRVPGPTQARVEPYHGIGCAKHLNKDWPCNCAASEAARVEPERGEP